MRLFSVVKFRCIFFENKRNLFFCSRSFNKLNEEFVTDKNPFKKKKYASYEIESDSRNSTRICITILGNGGVGQPRCIGLFTEFKGYLFNCGEGVGRYCKEYGINSWFIKHVFVTQRKWENISGLADLFISNQTQGVYQMFLYGPPGVEYFRSLVSSRVLDTKIYKKEGSYIDHTVDINYIPIALEKKENVENESDVVYAYVCKILEKPGDLLPDKCIEYGVPIGPDLLTLKNGGSVVLPSSKVVHAEDVNAPSYPERIFLIVDCPSELFLKSFVHEKDFQQYQTLHHGSSPICIFHFTPSCIFKSQEYQNWMRRFPEDTQHFVLNADNPIHGSIVLHQTEKYFNLLHPSIFRKLREKELAPKQNSFIEYSIDSKLIHLPPMLQIYVRPKPEFQWCNVVKNQDNRNLNVEGSDIVKLSPEFYKKLDDLKSLLLKKSASSVYKSIYPEVIFLGTSSSTSTAYRNVTAILLNTSPHQSILLDCGEGTFMQFARYFGSDVYSELMKISCIFISHIHLDHYMGLFEIISQRIKAFQQSGIPYKPLAVILPFDIRSIMMRFSEVFQNLAPATRLSLCKFHRVKRNSIKKFIGDLEMCTVPVKHCEDAWGIVIESPASNWKVVYSGDTAPCQTLIDAGKDCTLLIHESSIEDGLLIEAFSKKHSTPSQVLDVAEKMNAQCTILTHFSRRYQGFPVLPETNREIACAFDFMKVRRCDLPLLPLFTPVIKCLFEEQLDSFVEKTSMTVNFENIFLKVLKS